MRIEVRSDSVTIDGYVNAVARDSRPMTDPITRERFVEQMMPGVFERALRRNEVYCLLNHDADHVLGSTESNLVLEEDSIGLRAHVVIKDAEVVQKARTKKLRGWSFGFKEISSRTEDTVQGIKRRMVEDIILVEVSLVDDRKIPCYPGTSIETRAKGEELLRAESLETIVRYVEIETPAETADLSKYKERIKELEGEQR